MKRSPFPKTRETTPSWRGLWIVLDAMQETAGRHAEKLGVGVRDLHAKGLTWVLARFHVQFKTIPAAGRDRPYRHLADGPAPLVRGARFLI